MNRDIATVGRSAPDSRPGSLTLLMQDRDWVTAQFKAIMSLSGLGDRVIVGVFPERPADNDPRAGDEHPQWPATNRYSAARASPKERSPPTIKIIRGISRLIGRLGHAPHILAGASSQNTTKARTAFRPGLRTTCVRGDLNPHALAGTGT